jgi:hypothetical protein
MFSGIFVVEEVDGVGDKGVKRYQNGPYRYSWRPF